MNKKFYPITILKRDNEFVASIAELAISVKGPTYAETLEICIAKKDETIEMLNKKKIPLPEIIDLEGFQFFNIKTTKKISTFIVKSIASSLILLITLLLLIIMLSPFFKSYLNSSNAQNHFNKISNKFGISFCLEKECVKPNE